MGKREQRHQRKRVQFLAARRSRFNSRRRAIDAQYRRREHVASHREQLDMGRRRADRLDQLPGNHRLGH